MVRTIGIGIQVANGAEAARGVAFALTHKGLPRAAAVEVGICGGVWAVEVTDRRFEMAGLAANVANGELGFPRQGALDVETPLHVAGGLVVRRQDGEVGARRSNTDSGKEILQSEDLRARAEAAGLHVIVLPAVGDWDDLGR